MEALALIDADPTLRFALALFFGLFVGSFLNVVIHRLPLMMEREWRQACAELKETPSQAPDEPLNLAWPSSRCPHCSHPIGALENIPLLSYLWLKGRCRCCRQKISVRYPLVEAFTGLLTGYVFWQYGFTVEGVALFALTAALIAQSGIDIDHQLLADDITLPFLWLGLGLGLFGVFCDLESSVIGAMAGYLSLWSIYWLFKLITGKEGMGYGDFKLLAMLGAWAGWQALPSVVLFASLTGTVYGLARIATKRQGRETPIPFGPFLAAGGWLALVLGPNIPNFTLVDL
ncbi:MAG: prepilin peptidase [Candidatus Competibacterales bacterium]